MPSTKARILCVDDNGDTSLLLGVMLTRAGYEVAAAASVAETLALAGPEAFDLYLLDHRLPDGTGVELCGRLRELAPQTPVVFFSGAEAESERRSGLEAGARAYLLKPNDLDKVVATVGRFVGGAGGEGVLR